MEEGTLVLEVGGVTGLYKQYGLMPGSSWLDSVYLSWGETDSKAGVR